MYSYSRRRNVITPLQILSFYTKSKPIHMFLFTLLYLRRIKSMQYINPPIIVRLPERNGALHCAAHFCVYGICIITNNAEPIKYRNKNPNKFLHQSSFCVFKNLFNSFPLLAAIHLFISSHYEIIDFCSMEKNWSPLRTAFI